MNTYTLQVGTRLELPSLMTHSYHPKPNKTPICAGFWLIYLVIVSLYMGFAGSLAQAADPNSPQATEWYSSHFIGPERQARTLARTDFSAISRYGEILLRRYPADQFIIISVGRSPTPIVAYAEAKGGAEIYHLPLSGISYFTRAGRLPPDGSQLLHHLKNFLPAGTKVAQRKVVVLDYSISGQSLLHTFLYIKNFYTSQGFDFKYKVTPFTAEEYLHEALSTFQFIQETPDPIVIDNESPLALRLILSEYKSLARYSPFDIRSDNPSANIKLNPAYDVFVSELKGRLPQSRASTADCGQIIRMKPTQ
jgi:hypothetical protein